MQRAGHEPRLAAYGQPHLVMRAGRIPDRRSGCDLQLMNTTEGSRCSVAAATVATVLGSARWPKFGMLIEERIYGVGVTPWASSCCVSASTGS